MTKRRVVITGMGAITPIGLSAAESWKNAKAGTYSDMLTFTVKIVDR